MTILTLLTGAYCAVTYYIQKDFLWEALDKKHGTGWRLFATSMFVFAPITLPLQLGILLSAKQNMVRK